MSVQVTRRRFTVEEYHRMAEAGILAEDDRVELIEGEIIEMAAIGRLHAACVDRLTAFLVEAVGKQANVRVQNPVHLSMHSEVQPDLALLRRRADFYAAGHPGPADTLLVIEIADSTLLFDRRIKMPLYARMNIPEAWLVNLEQAVVDVYREPTPGGYRMTQVVARGQHLSPTAFPDLSLSIDDILG